MNKLSSTTIAALTITAGLFAGDARADHNETIDELAVSLMRQTAAATREVRFGFRRSPQFKHLYQDVYDMYCAAKHVHDVSHNSPNRQHLLNDVQELDELIHHTQELIEEMSGRGNGHATHGHRGYGVPNQYHLRRLNSLMYGIVETVHELQDVVGYSQSNGPVLNGPPVVVPPVAPPAPVVFPRSPVGRRSGFEIRRSGRSGRLSFSLRIR
jgi:hypothetical protein